MDKGEAVIGSDLQELPTPSFVVHLGNLTKQLQEDDRKSQVFESKDETPREDSQNNSRSSLSTFRKNEHSLREMYQFANGITVSTLGVDILTFKLKLTHFKEAQFFADSKKFPNILYAVANL